MLKPRDIIGAAIDLELDGKVLKATSNYFDFKRSRDGLENPKIDLMEGIVNHFRIFAI